MRSSRLVLVVLMAVVAVGEAQERQVGASGSCRLLQRTAEAEEEEGRVKRLRVVEGPILSSFITLVRKSNFFLALL